jgi:uncharacterized protein YbjQ (UPF0145 family)
MQGPGKALAGSVKGIWWEGRMIVTTTPSIEGRAIVGYLGIVTGEAILGANIFRDICAGIRDIVGGRSAAYEEELAKARRTALAEMEAEATRLGADAVVGVDLDYEVVNNMLMVTSSGTAVRLG